MHKCKISERAVGLNFFLVLRKRQTANYLLRSGHSKTANSLSNIRLAFCIFTFWEIALERTCKKIPPPEGKKKIMNAEWRGSHK